MDLWTFNKLAAAVLLSLLVIFGGSTAISILYPEGGPGEYQVVQVEGDTETAEADQAEQAEEEAPQDEPLPVRLAAADPSAGETVARQCAACHVFEEGGANRVGPNLYAVPGREVASVEGFSYSGALQEYGGEWTYEKLDCFLENPSECVPGTSMGYAGVKDPQDRADLIAYLASLGDTPPFPEPEETAQAPAETEQAAQPEAPPAEDGEAAGDQETAQEEESTDMAAAGDAADMDAADDAANADDGAADTETAGEAGTEETAEPATGGEASGESELAALFANADAAAGEKAVRVCAACHSFNEGGPTKVGPNLYGIMGRQIAAVDGFNYSNSLKSLDGEWTYERMNEWLANPMDYVPGTTMAYPGVKDDAKRADIIAYLASLGDAPPLPGAEKDTGAADNGKDSAKASDSGSDTEAASLERDTTAN